MDHLAEVPESNDEKYITFKREEFFQMVGLWSSQHMPAVNVANLIGDADTYALPDAVVIRRQDFFAPGALASYASGIALVLNMIDDPKQRAQMLAVADYFQRQSEIAGDEAWKWPDL